MIRKNFILKNNERIDIDSLIFTDILKLESVMIVYEET